MNCFFAKAVLYKEIQKNEIGPYAEILSQSGQGQLRQKVKEFAVKNGMIELSDTSGTNIGVQIFDPVSYTHLKSLTNIISKLG